MTQLVRIIHSACQHKSYRIDGKPASYDQYYEKFDAAKTVDSFTQNSGPARDGCTYTRFYCRAKP